MKFHLFSSLSHNRLKARGTYTHNLTLEYDYQIVAYVVGGCAQITRNINIKLIIKSARIYTTRESRERTQVSVLHSLLKAPTAQYLLYFILTYPLHAYHKITIIVRHLPCAQYHGKSAIQSKHETSRHP